MIVYLILYMAALLPSVGLTAVAICLSKKLNLGDLPGVRKVHKEPIPRIGGVAVYASVALPMTLVLLVLDPMRGISGPTDAQMATVMLGATIVFMLGLIDDVKPLRARLKLFVQLAAATLVYGGGIRIESIGVGEWSPIDLGWLAWPVTVFWIVGITNAVNLSDGVDGLATSLSMAACGVVAMLSIWGDQPPITTLMVTVLGALTGFLCFNFHPARIFLGDSGSLFLGFTISAASILCFLKSQTFATLVLPAIVLGVPILDMALSIVRRFVTRRPIFAPDRGHVHHRLLQLGLGQREVVGVICGLTLVASGLSMLLLSADARTSLALLGAILILLFALFYAVEVIRFRPAFAGLLSRLHLSHQARDEISEFCNLQLRFDRAQDSKAWWQALCEAAKQLDFAWLSVDVADSAGNTETYLWRRTQMPPLSARLTIIEVPVRGASPGVPVKVEVAVLTNGSIEGAARRASLFGRLMDEYQMPAFDRTASDFMVNMSAPVPERVTRLGGRGDMAVRLASHQVPAAP